jgi:hypothetical protein
MSRYIRAGFGYHVGGERRRPQRGIALARGAGFFGPDSLPQVCDPEPYVPACPAKLSVRLMYTAWDLFRTIWRPCTVSGLCHILRSTNGGVCSLGYLPPIGHVEKGLSP